MKKIIILIIISTIAFASCSTDNPLKQEDSKSNSGIFANPYLLSLGFADDYDTLKIDGVFTLASFQEDYYTNEYSTTHFAEHFYYGYAFLVNSQRKAYSNEENIKINNFQLSKDRDNYFHTAKYKANSNSGFKLFFGKNGSNIITKSASALYPSFSHSITLSDAIELQNFKANQNIDPNNDLVLNWEGTDNNTYYSVFLASYKTLDPTVGSKELVYVNTFNFKNQNSLTIPKNILDSCTGVFNEIKISKYEIFLKPISEEQDRNILYFGESNFRTTFLINR